MAKSRKKTDRGPAAAANANNDDRDRVAARAYEIYQARGGGDGLAVEDWLAAEREAGQEPRRGNDDER